MGHPSEAGDATLVTENGAPPSPGGFGELVETSRRVINGTLVIDYRNPNATEAHPSAPPPPPETASLPAERFMQQQPVQQQQLQQQQAQAQAQEQRQPEEPEKPRMTDAQLRRWIEAYEPDRLW